MSNHILISEPSPEYELIDAGDGKKLERYGVVRMVRPDPQALFPVATPKDGWRKVDAEFIRKGSAVSWKVADTVPKEWPVVLSGLTFFIRPTSFKHTGLFPEQAANWEWMEKQIRDLRSEKKDREINVLNLFGYTGGATLACARAGASVCHVDGSKMAISWARKNQEASGLADKPIRWILDDARAFLRREVKRGNRYDAIIMDPPKFGHGPKGETWKIEDDFEDLMELSRQVLSDDPLFFLMSGYASGYSALAYENNLLPLTEKYGGTTFTGELAIRMSASKRLLPCGIVARWSK